MTQRDKKKIAGQLRAISDHEKKKAAYSDPRDKTFADKTIGNAQSHLDRLRAKKK
jgi:hypothetical protein